MVKLSLECLVIMHLEKSKSTHIFFAWRAVAMMIILWGGPEEKGILNYTGDFTTEIMPAVNFVSAIHWTN